MMCWTSTGSTGVCFFLIALLQQGYLIACTGAANHHHHNLEQERRTQQVPAPSPSSSSNNQQPFYYVNPSNQPSHLVDHLPDDDYVKTTEQPSYYVAPWNDDENNENPSLSSPTNQPSYLVHPFDAQLTTEEPSYFENLLDDEIPTTGTAPIIGTTEQPAYVHPWKRENFSIASMIPEDDMSVVAESSSGIMFDVIAAGYDIEVTGFDLHVSLDLFSSEAAAADTNKSVPNNRESSSTAATIIIYSRKGTHQGYERRPGAWNLYDEITVPLSQIQKNDVSSSTALGVNPIFIPATSTQAFYIFTASSNLMQYDVSSYTSTTGDVFASDPNIAIFVGVGMVGESPFYSSAIIANRVLWNGVLHYRRLPGSNSNTNNNNNRGIQTLESGDDFQGDIAVAGTMFEVTAASENNNNSNNNKNTKIRVEGLDIHVDSVGPVPIEVYTRAGPYKGYARRPSAWSLYFSGTVQGRGPGVPTPVGPITAAHEQNPIIIGQNNNNGGTDVQSFYVTVLDRKNNKSSILCGAATNAGLQGNNDLHASNTVASVLSGAIIGDGLFSSSIGGGDGCAWDGILYYTELDGEARDATGTAESGGVEEMSMAGIHVRCVVLLTLLLLLVL